MNRRQWLMGLLTSIPLAVIAKGQKKDVELIYCKPIPLEDEEHRYSVYSLEKDSRFVDAQARAKYEELYLDRLKKFGEKAKDALDAYQRTKLEKYNIEHKLWVDAVLCAGACLEDVRRLRRRYDKIQILTE